MEWIFYIIGGFLLIAFLWGIGFIPELLTMVFMALIAGVVTGGISSLFSWGFAAGFDVGIIIGLVMYGVYCIMRLCSDNYTITVFSDGRQEKDFESYNGLIGLIVMIVCGIYYAIQRFG